MTSHDDLIARAEYYVRPVPSGTAYVLGGARDNEPHVALIRDLTAALKECRERRDEAVELVQIIRAQHKRHGEQTTALLREAMDALGPFVGVAEALNDAGRHGHGNYSEWVGKLQPIDFGQARLVADRIKERLNG